jgi:hypothetical protein
MWGLYRIINLEKVTGSVWEGFRTGITAGYRFNRLGVEMGVNYYSSNDKTMAHKQQIDLFLRMIQPAATYVSFTAKDKLLF